ncbi:MAG: hypothetical protein AAGF89_11690 [Bacteroidota bacterium]
MRYLLIVSLISLLAACQDPTPTIPVYTTDIDHYWEAYDQIIATDDTAAQENFLQTLYLDRASPGLKKLMEVRNYTAEEYLENINAYPNFWASIRENTLQAKTMKNEFQAGFTDLKQLYDCPKPASAYFAIGAFRSGGTAVDSFVLIGGEFTLADDRVDATEFPENIRANRIAFFASNPINDVYGLFVHEFVHTQQEPIPDYLLGQCLYEGVAEYVSCLATGTEPDTAVRYGQAHPEAVLATFEREMFYQNNQPKWLWSNAPNQFERRDLGYYIGYTISERYYRQATDKKEAIRELVEIDYTDTSEVRRVIDASGYLSAPVEELYAAYRMGQPKVVDVQRNQNTFTVTFSETMDTRWRNFNFGPSGAAGSMRVASVKGFSDDGLEFTFTVQPLPIGAKREMILGSGFRDESGAGLVPYLIEVLISE